MKLQQSVLGSEERRRSSLADGPLMALSNFGPHLSTALLQDVSVFVIHVFYIIFFFVHFVLSLECLNSIDPYIRCFISTFLIS